MRKNETIAINYKIEKSIFDKFDNFCNKRNLSKTSVVEEALKKYITEKEEDEEIVQKYRSGRFDFVEKEK